MRMYEGQIIQPMHDIRSNYFSRLSPPGKLCRITRTRPVAAAGKNPGESSITALEIKAGSAWLPSGLGPSVFRGQFHI